MKIGIPRALLYYWYGGIWEQFWQKCDQTVIISPFTDHGILKAGIEVAVDELCLPVKIFLGHVRSLEPMVDLIMIPHLNKVERDAYICPKFMGLPDVVSHAVPSVKDKMMVVKVGPRDTSMMKGLEHSAANYGIGVAKKKFTRPGWLFKSKNLQDSQIPPENPAQNILTAYVKKFGKAESNLTIGLLGHPYCLYDSFFNHNLLSLLANNNIKFLTPEMIPSSYRGIGSGLLNKSLFWTMGRFQFDALEWMLHGEPVNGFILVTPFACGPEAIVGNLLERRIKQAGKPVLQLNFEEHSGEAGIITRLEAFLDLIKYRHKVC